MIKQIAYKNATSLDLNEDPNTYITRRKMKKLLPSLYERTNKKQKSLKNKLIVVYNWIKTLNSILDNMDSVSKNELIAKIKRISHLCIVHNKDVFQMFH